MCYACLRLGNALPQHDIEDKINAGLFLCASKKSLSLEALQPEWDRFLEENNYPGIETRISFIRNIYNDFSKSEIFSFSNQLSEGIDEETFILSHLQQPDLFIRIRPGHKAKVITSLREQKVAFEYIEPFTLRLPNSFQADTIAVIDKEIVVQDYSSQLTGGLMQLLKTKRDGDKKPAAGSLKVWDCCAASGGKSIMAFDLLPGIQLTVTDIRQSILENLRKRFTVAGIKKYTSFILDLSSASLVNNTKLYDLVIVDAPCSGSGTWGRTPERLSFFATAEIDYYAALQKKIVANAITFLKPGGALLYITCSVFKKENEDIVGYIQRQTSAVLLKQELIEGYYTKADSMFAALLTPAAERA